MYLEKMKHKDRRGHIYHHYCLTSREGGRVVRKYVPRASLPFVRQMLDEKDEIKKFASSLKEIFGRDSPGPSPAICEMQRDMLKSSGYRLAGGMRVTRDRKKFFGKEQVEFRHSILDPGAIAIARTPEDLERIEREAIKLQTSFARSRVKCKTYEMCLAAVFSAEAAKGRSAPMPA